MLAKILAGLDQSDRIGFLTLTSKPGTSWPDIMKAWSRMAAFLRLESPYLQYAAVKEEGTNNGMRHLHVVMVNFAFTPQQRLSAKWRSLTGAWVVNIQRVQGERTAGYVAKYVGKADSNLRKKVTFSRGWPKLPPHLSLRWLTASPWWSIPYSWKLIVQTGGLAQFMANDCDCYPLARPPNLEEIDWLRLTEVHSSLAFQAS